MICILNPKNWCIYSYNSKITKNIFTYVVSFCQEKKKRKKKEDWRRRQWNFQFPKLIGGNINIIGYSILVIKLWFSG